MKDKEKPLEKINASIIDKVKHDNNLPDKQDQIDINLDNDNTIPEEIDTHFQMYGKHAWEVEYGEKCPICNKRIDEYGFCACGSQGD
jgi:DNA repair exonuclease SbcCD ATPase subunit